MKRKLFKTDLDIYEVVISDNGPWDSWKSQVRVSVTSRTTKEEKLYLTTVNTGDINSNETLDALAKKYIERYEDWQEVEVIKNE